MSKERLQRFKSITTWGGAATTLCGIILSYANGGGLAAAGLSAFGLLLTCCGYWITSAVTRHQEAERKAEYEAHAKRAAALESENLSIQRRIEEVRRMTYNAP